MDLARGGMGVARAADGRVVFIPGTLPGDRVRARITRQEKRHAIAELEAVIEPSPDRVEPRCPVFGACGGCQWQHVPYGLQWKTKFGGVRSTLEKRLGAVVPRWIEVPAESPWEYRNRVQLRGQGDRLGYYRSGSRELVAADGCPIARPEINAAWAGVREEGRKREGEYKVEVEVLPSGEVVRSWDERHGAHGFRQVNDAQNARLREQVAAGLTEGRELLDLYGGDGNLSLGLASRMRSVDVVDVSSPRRPPEGTPRNMRFHASNVVKWLGARRAGASESTPSVILDPPRQGLGGEAPDILDALDRLHAAEAVLVGCDPDAWVRDLGGFLSHGWEIRQASVIDLFPQTPHVESVACLTRLGSPPTL